MMMEDPDNTELDAIFMRAAKHPEVRVELLAEMLTAELYTLVPRKQSARPPEMIARPEGKELEFIQWQQEGRMCFFVYTSARMARKGLKFFSRLAQQPMVIIGMDGEELLQLLYEPGVGIALNPGTDTCEMTFNDKTLAGILDGSLFDGGPGSAETQMSGKATALRPEEYPLSLVQPVFDHLKSRPEVLAAWVLQTEESEDAGGNCYVFALLTAEEDSHSLEHSVGTVLGLIDRSERRDMEFGVTSFDYSNPAHVNIMRTYVPFYAAPGYHSPVIPGEE